MSIAETTSTLTRLGAVLAMRSSVALDYEPMDWSDSMAQNFRLRDLKEKHGERGVGFTEFAQVPNKIIESLTPEILRQCKESVSLGMEQNAIRLAYCQKRAHVFECPNCGQLSKKAASCKNRMCPECAPRNFDILFARFAKIDKLIPAAVRCQLGYGWHVLDFSFRHDGDMPTQSELRLMVKVIRRTVERTVKETRRDLVRAGAGCKLVRNEDGTPKLSADGWPMAIKVKHPGNDPIELKGWQAVEFSAHEGPDNAARKRGIKGAKKKIPTSWKLRFGYELIRVTEFGFDNVNAHFHSAFFGPSLDYGFDEKLLKQSRRLVCWGRLVDIFKEESLKVFGEESYTVFFQKARQGFESVLAHALKYTKKIPSSTPEGLARLEHVLQGTRRVALLGAHYGIPLKSKPRDPICPTPNCGAAVKRVPGLGLVPLSEVADLPDVKDCGYEGQAADFVPPDDCEGVPEGIEARAP